MVISMIFYYLCCNSSIDIFDSMPRKLVIMLLMILLLLMAAVLHQGCATMKFRLDRIAVPNFRKFMYRHFGRISGRRYTVLRSTNKLYGIDGVEQTHQLIPRGIKNGHNWYFCVHKFSSGVLLPSTYRFTLHSVITYLQPSEQSSE